MRRPGSTAATFDSDAPAATASALAARIAANQENLRSALQPHYDFIVCGSGSSGSVVARRLAENAAVRVLLLEAGGDDDAESVTKADQWPVNLGGARDWNYVAEPGAGVNGRALPMNMGKVLGGGSSINVMVWARGHQNDWDHFAAETGDPRWGYRAVLDIYRSIEDWRGLPDPAYRGAGGPVFVQPAPDPNPVAPAAVVAARSVGIPSFDHHNGTMMEGRSGASISDLRIRNGLRQSVFRSYTYPYLDRPNLTVLTGALVHRVLLRENRATGVEFSYRGATHRIDAGLEIVLCLGAVQTPKALMLSGIGDHEHLTGVGIDTVAHLPGVGQNLQDHAGFSCVWEYRVPLPARNSASEATVFWTSDHAEDTPDVQICQIEAPFTSAENAAQFGMPAAGSSLFTGLMRPASRGHLELTGSRPTDPVRIHANMLSDPADLAVAVAAVELCREIGNSAALSPFSRREVMPGDLTGRDLERFVRDAASTYWHQTCTAKMGRDEMSVVDSELRVHGIDGLRIADGSVLPRITTGNTMAPCVIIGERAGRLILDTHGL